MTQFSRRGAWKKLDQADYEFHRATVEASQHRRLIRAYDISQIRVLTMNLTNSEMRAQPREATAQLHLPIVDCIERGDAAGAEKASYEHVREAMQKWQNERGFIVQNL
jgi:DNA-binding FadR family transcriptional regulator